MAFADGTAGEPWADVKGRGCWLAWLGAGLAGLGVLHPAMWCAVFPGLAAFLHVVSEPQMRPPRAMLAGLLFGAVTGGAGCAWFWHTLPLDFLGIRDPVTQHAAVGITWIYVSLSLALPVALAAPLLGKMLVSRAGPVLVASLWVLVEWARMWIFALTTWAPEALLGPNFSAAALGHVLTETSWLRPLAWPWGVDGLNFCVALIAALASSVVRTGTRRRLPTLACQAAIPAVLLLVSRIPPAQLPARAATKPLHFAVVASQEPEVLGLSTPARLRAQLAAIAQRRPAVDVILLPEEIGITNLFWSPDEARAFFDTHFGNRDFLLINSRDAGFLGEAIADRAQTKILSYESSRRGELARYQKQNLMPLGEYAPQLTAPVFSVLRDAELGLHVEAISVLPPRKSRGSMQGVLHKGIRVAGLLCSDLFSAALYREVGHQKNVDVLVNLANQFWFHGSRILHWKTLQIARTHAVENRLPLLVANNMAPAFALGPAGELLAESRWGTPETLYVQLP